MRDTRLFAKIGNTWKELDLYDNLDLSINFEVSEIKDISKKSTNYSQTISLPNTENNANVFEHCYEIGGVAQTFQLLEPYPCYVTAQNTVIFNGLFKLTQVNREKGEIWYEGLVYSEVKHFFDLLGEETLRGNDDSTKDLNFSEYTLMLNQTNVSSKLSSFNYDAGHPDYNPLDLEHSPYQAKGVGFTLIDKTDWGNTGSIGETGMHLNVEDVSPFLYVKEIWDKIFKQKGFSYVSKFLDHVPGDSKYADISHFPFRSLVYPYCSNNANFKWLDDSSLIVTASANDLSDEVFWVQGGTPVDMVHGNNVDINGTAIQIYRPRYNYNMENSQMLGQTDFLRWQPDNAGIYHIKGEMPYKLAFQFNYTTGGSQGRLHEPTVTYKYVMDDIIFRVRLVTNTGRQLAKWYKYINFDAGETFELDADSYYTSVGYYYVIDEDNIKFDHDIRIYPNEFIRFVCDYFVPYRTSNGNVQYFTWHSDVGGYDAICFPSPVLHWPGQQEGYQFIDISPAGGNFLEGMQFNPTYILNPKTRKSDFIRDIITMFNLYIEDISGKDDGNGGVYYDRTFRIEPYTMYYFDNDSIGGLPYATYDWSRKIDYKQLAMGRNEDYLHKTLNFNYTNDKDYWCQSYADKFQEQYACRSILKGDGQEKLDVNLKAGQTYCGLLSSKNDEIIMPRIYTFDTKGAIQRNKTYSDRYLFLFKNTLSTSTIRIDSVFQSPVWLRTYNAVDVVNAFNDNDSACLMWNSSDGTTNAYGWDSHPGSDVLTTRNIYNTFWLEMVARYASVNNRIIKADFYLTYSDVYNFRMSNTIIINGVKYFVLSMKQWSGSTEPCEVTLMKYTPLQYEDIADMRKHTIEAKSIDAKNVLASVEENAEDLTFLAGVVADVARVNITNINTTERE